MRWRTVTFRKGEAPRKYPWEDTVVLIHPRTEMQYGLFVIEPRLFIPQDMIYEMGETNDAE